MDDEVLFAALPASQTLSFNHVQTSTHICSLRAPPNSSYLPSLSTTTLPSSSLPPRKTVVFHPCQHAKDHASIVMTLSGKDGRNGIDYWASLAGKGAGGHSVPSSGKVVPMGKVTVFSVSRTGTWLAVGTADGRIMIWEASHPLGTGTLVATWDAHYRAVTCLEFSPLDDCLVSASEDSLAHIWGVVSVIDAAATPLKPPQPWTTLADHTMPISDLAFSPLSTTSLRILTASLDGTVKMWCSDDPEKPLLATFQLPGPAHHVVFDALDRHFYATYLTPLASAPASSSKAPPAPQGSTVVKVDLYAFPSDPLNGGTGGAALFPTPLGISHSPPTTSRTYSTPAPLTITALHLPLLPPTNGPAQLLLGLSNGTVVHLSAADLQPLRTTSLSPNATAGSDPVVLISTVQRPRDLVTPSSSTGATLDAQPSHKPSTDLPAPRPVGQLGRAIGRSGTSTVSPAPPPSIEGEDAYLASLFSRTTTVLPSGINASNAAALAAAFTPPDLRSEIRRTLDRARGEPGWGRRGYASGLLAIRGESDPSAGGEWDGVGDMEDEFALDPEMLFHGAETGYESLRKDGPGSTGAGGGEEEERLRKEVEELKSRLGQAMDLNDRMWKGVVEGTFALPSSQPASTPAAGGGDVVGKEKRKRARTNGDV